MSAYNLLVASSISMIILIKVSSPLNMKRKILCIVCGVVLVGGVLFFGDFFSVTTIFQWRMIFVIPVVAITYPMMNGFMEMMRRLTSIRHKRKKTVVEEG